MNHKALIKHLPLPGTDPFEDTAPNQIHAAQWVCTVRGQAVPERTEQVSPLRPSPKVRSPLPVLHTFVLNKSRTTKWVNSYTVKHR